jgi:hypothetical protein
MLGLVLRKHVKNGLCWNFDMDAKLDILSKFLGKNILIGIRVCPPRLGACIAQ